MKFIRNLIILGVILTIIFLAIAISSGGDSFRWFGTKVGGLGKDVGQKLAVEADSLRKWALQYQKKVKGQMERVPEEVKEPVIRK
jgi:hypothetical protein